MKKRNLYIMIFYAIITIFLSLLFTTTLSASTAFSNLKTFKLDNGIVIQYDPTLSQLINQKIPNEAVDLVLVMTTRLDRNSKEIYRVIYSSGPSDDPAFIIERKVEGDWKEVSYLAGLTLVLPGNGLLYTSGHTNNMFDMKRKFILRSSDKIEEIRQPFYYVGKSTKTLEPVTLYQDQTLKEQVAALPKDYQVTVLLNQDDFYLVVTDFGLTGWVRLELSDRIFEGIYYAGD